jgi:hypothetical protein
VTSVQRAQDPDVTHIEPGVVAGHHQPGLGDAQLHSRPAQESRREPQILASQVAAGQQLDPLQTRARQRNRPAIPSRKDPPVNSETGINGNVAGQVRHLEQQHGPVRRAGIASDHHGAVARSKPGRDILVSRTTAGNERHEPASHSAILAWHTSQPGHPRARLGGVGIARSARTQRLDSWPGASWLIAPLTFDLVYPHSADARTV